MKEHHHHRGAWGTLSTLPAGNSTRDQEAYADIRTAIVASHTTVRVTVWMRVVRELLHPHRDVLHMH